ncbi:hypothetical protein [Wolbachia endosymbiont of Folsomia candida]|uniref:hypothetical protein n=1 Tax=Wolbachia endosymbiont of Folsomia candida TaxID=169402 RepID=UPI000A8CD5FA|nr:hypothetical protein [Wolbachia endosymbiont of Folsomia candida]APR98027.1 hypothetical protein ASM33_01760 [Wolbachia endosymbiont of Folsomia candida]
MNDKIFMQEHEAFMQTENNNESSMDLDSTEEEQLINHMTLEGALKALKLDNLLPELDDNLELIATGKKSVDDHKEYFKTQVDPKLRNVSRNYHPDIVENKGGSKEEILQATEMQKKINSVRMILSHFNKKFSKCVGFEYSFFAQIEINVLSDEKRLEELSYGVLTKLGKLARIKHEKLVPNLNGFLRSSQASMKCFSENNLGGFLQEKDNALSYFSKYLSSHKESVNELKLLKASFKQDDQLSSICSMIDKMLKKSMMQFEILNQLSKLFNGNGLELISTKFKFFRDLDCKQDYQQADKYFTLPFIAYINILFLCNEVYLKEQSEEQKNGKSQTLVSYIPFQTVANFFKKGSAMYKIAPIDEEIAKKVDVLQANDLYKISRYLVAYYCDDNKKGRKLAAELLGVDEISKEMAGALLIKVIGVYANHLAEEFKPGKTYEERVIELLMEQQEIIKNGFGRLIEIERGFNDELRGVLEKMKEANATLIPRTEEAIRKSKELSKKNEDSIRKSDEMISRMDAILGIPGVQAAVQIWQEAGDMYRSNLSETKSSEEESCTENVSMSGSDIEVIDPIIPSTAMDELRLSTCNQIGKSF